MSADMEDMAGCKNTCESTEMVSIPLETEKCNSTCESTELIPTSLGTEAIAKCNSACENAEIIPTSVVVTEPQLCFQLPTNSPHDPVLCDMKSDIITNILTTTHQSSLQNEEFSPKSNKVELDVSQTSHNTIGSNIFSDSNSLLDIIPKLKDTVEGSVQQEIQSQCTYASVSPTIENMDSTDYNLETQKADSGSCSHQMGPICEDQALQPSSEQHEAVKERNGSINGFSSGKTEGGNDESSLNVDVKQEPYDPEYDRPNLIYRAGVIIVNSDDDTSSTMFSKNSAAGSDGDNDVSDEEVVVRLNARKITMSKNGSRTEGEIFPEELPPIEYLIISPGEDVVVESVGAVSGIVGVLVIVKGDLNSPALYDDTVLFLQGRQPLGLIFEIFGTVEQPYYSVRFNNSRDIRDKDINVGDQVFFAPRADNLTKYVFISELKKIKCDDASWEHDNEPPPAHVEFSDDEEEKRARQRLRNKVRGADENQGDFACRKKRRRKPHSEYGKGNSDPQGPQLLQGDLNRNPFGNKDHKFSSSMTTRWPNSGSHGQVGNGHSYPGPRPTFSPRSSPQPPPPSFGAFRKPWTPQADFGDRPAWNYQSGVLGDVPNAPRMDSLNTGGFGNSNTLSSHQFRPFPRFSSMPYQSPPSTPSHGSRLPHSSMPSQINNFGGGPYFSRPNMEHINTSAPPPPSQIPGLQNRQPHRFPVFNPSCPPPVVSSVFNIPPPL